MSASFNPHPIGISFRLDDFLTRRAFLHGWGVTEIDGNRDLDQIAALELVPFNRGRVLKWPLSIARLTRLIRQTFFLPEDLPIRIHCRRSTFPPNIDDFVIVD
ncbi:hypothetical protein OC842_007745, partial [Tilletia horrida]